MFEYNYGPAITAAIEQAHATQAATAPAPQAAARFVVGETYYARAIGDQNCIYVIKATKRTPKMLTFERNGKTRRAKININDRGEEYIMPNHWSMAPIFSASDVAQKEFERLAELEKERFYAYMRDRDNLHAQRLAELARFDLENFAARTGCHN